MKKDLLVILLLCFLGFTFVSCDDSSEPENGGEVEQTAPAWTIGVWETTADVAEVYQKEFEGEKQLETRISMFEEVATTAVPLLTE